MSLHPYSEPASLDDANLSDKYDFLDDDSDQPEADNVFTDDDNEGDEIDAELDLTPSWSWQKEKLRAADGTEWTMATTHAEYENPPSLSVIVPQ